MNRMGWYCNNNKNINKNNNYKKKDLLLHDKKFDEMVEIYLIFV